MYAIASRVGPRCQYTCALCLNTTVQRGENIIPLFRRLNSTSPPADFTSEGLDAVNITLVPGFGENGKKQSRRQSAKRTTKKDDDVSSKLETTSPDPLDAWLQQLAAQGPKKAKKSNQAAQTTMPVKTSSPSEPLLGKLKKKLPRSNKDRIKTAKKSEPVKKKDEQKLAANKKNSVQRKSTALEAQGLSINDSPPVATSKSAKKTARRKAGARAEAKSVFRAPLVLVPRKVISKGAPMRPLRKRARAETKSVVGVTPGMVPRRVISRREPMRPFRKRAPVAIVGKDNTSIGPLQKVNSEIRPVSPKLKGPLLSRLHSITAAYGNRVQKRVVLTMLEKNMLNSHGVRLTREDEVIFKDVPCKELAESEPGLTLSLLAAYESLESALKPPKADKIPTTREPLKQRSDSSFSGTVCVQDLQLVPIEKPQPPVPRLVCGLERVLFNHGVYQLRDPHSRVYNFDPYLESITPVKEFDYDALKEYITSSRDTILLETAVTEGKKYTGSTSSMTSALSHFHYLLSKWRPVNLDQLSRGFPDPLTSFTALQRAPAAIFLRRRGSVYAIDANKQFDTSNILQWLGKSMEKFLTMEKEEYLKYRKEHSHALTEDDKNSPESYHYTTFGDFLMRSQLDAYDPRLPGTGMYDLKTRAVVSIRKNATEYEGGLGYEIKSRQGEWESYEREYYDMCRSAFLKYSLQVRMGRMDGIFVAFHNTERIFGFQYLPLSDMDAALHGTTHTTLGDSEFKVSLELLNKVLDRATERFPEDSLQMQFETRPKNTTNGDCFMYIFVRPVADEKIQSIQESNLSEIQEYEKRVIGLHGDEQIEATRLMLEEIAKAEKAEEQEERLEAAFDNINKPMSLEIIRKAVESMKGGTLTEKSMTKLLDLLAARTEKDEPETVIDDAKEPFEALDQEASKTPADEVQEEQASEPTTTDPVMVLKLTIRNTVNGQEVIRPSRLMPKDKWEVEYTIEEITKNPEVLFNASVERRKKGLSNEPFKKWFDGGKYATQIVNKVDGGRRYRQEMDMLDEKHGVTVFDKQEFEDFGSHPRAENEMKKEV